MADVIGHGEAGANNCKIVWDLHFDDAANTVTISAVHTHFDGSPAPDPQKAWITVRLNSSVDITVDTLTGKMGTPDRPPEDPAAVLTNQQNFSQASPGPMLNAGVKPRTGVKLKVSADRAAAISFSTQYTAPA
jgi:hypothetical protein